MPRRPAPARALPRAGRSRAALPPGRLLLPGGPPGGSSWPRAALRALLLGSSCPQAGCLSAAAPTPAAGGDGVQPAGALPPWLPGEVPGEARPRASGCFVRMPSGCPRQASWDAGDGRAWQKDAWSGWKSNRVLPKDGRATCEVQRRAGLSVWCGVADVQARWVGAVEAYGAVAPVVPPRPGCYVWMASGCPRQHGFDPSHLHRFAPDSWHGWQDGRVRQDLARAVCERERKEKLDAWCGTSGVVTVYTPRPPPEPREPGCYVWLGSGCPAQPGFDAGAWQTSWQRDAAGNVSRVGCGDERRHRINDWCGTADARVLYIEDPPAALGQPGCHVWMPSGCPRQKAFDSSRYLSEWALDQWSAWRGATFGRFDAGTRRKCEERQAHLGEWCGTADIRTLYVPVPPDPPEAPGCNLQLPSGCPRQPRFDPARWQGRWGLDEWHGWAQTRHLSDAERRGICEQTRRRAVDEWCGVSDTEAVWMVAAAPVEAAPQATVPS